jgi:hypothetical protein
LAALALGFAGAVVAPLWPLMTFTEIHDGWGHFYWENPALTEKLAWLTSTCAAVAAVSALVFAWRLRAGRGHLAGTWFAVSVGTEVVAVVGWLSVIAY